MTKPCPMCGKKMIQRDTGVTITSKPPQHTWIWWCGCGHIEEGGVRTDVVLDLEAALVWEMAQRGMTNTEAP